MEDQLTAHLDRGWDLAQKGDPAGASACAKRALEIDPQSPEVHNLMGFAAALEGDADEALEHYRQAIALDETYFEAMLNAAEVMIAPLGDHDGAIVQIEEALDYAETDEEIADCILLKVDALMAKADYEEAKRAMKMLPDGPFNGPTYLFLIGRAWYELGQIDKAAPLIEQAAKADPQSADAQYYLGLVRDEQGDSRGATEALLRSRSLDAMRAPPPWAPSPEAFATVVRGVIEKLDMVLARYVREAEVYVVDLPGAELVVDGVDPRALLVLDTPPTEEGAATRGAHLRLPAQRRASLRRARGNGWRARDRPRARSHRRVPRRPATRQERAQLALARRAPRRVVRRTPHATARPGEVIAREPPGSNLRPRTRQPMTARGRSVQLPGSKLAPPGIRLAPPAVELSTTLGHRREPARVRLRTSRGHGQEAQGSRLRPRAISCWRSRGQGDEPARSSLGIPAVEEKLPRRHRREPARSTS